MEKKNVNDGLSKYDIVLIVIYHRNKLWNLLFRYYIVENDKISGG